MPTEMDQYPDLNTWESIQRPERPELSDERSKQRAKETLARNHPLPQLLKLNDGKFVDSYPYLTAKGVEIIADTYHPWPEKWYTCILPESLHPDAGEVYDAPSYDENRNWLFTIMGLRVEQHNISHPTEPPKQPFIKVSPEEKV